MSAAYERERFDIIVRRDFATFIFMAFKTIVGGQEYLPNWHIQAMADHLRRCLTGEIKRLVINLPPRNLKSICASVALPAWILGHDPTKRIICLSYSFELAAKHSRECRAVMESDWYRRVFPRTRSRDLAVRSAAPTLGVYYAPRQAHGRSRPCQPDRVYSLR